MQGPCVLIPYITSSGQSPVLDFLSDLERYDAVGFAKWIYVRGQLETNGTESVGKLWTRLPGGLGEIRWRSKKKRLRIYCSEESQKRVVMYQPVEKKWLAFDNTDKDLCNRRRADFCSGSYDQERRHLEYMRRNKGHA